MKKNLDKSTEHTSVNVRSIMPDGIFLTVLGKDYFLSFDRLPWFRDAKVSDILDVRMIGDMAISWNKLDVGLEIESLVHPEKFPQMMKRTLDEVI